MKAVTLDNIYQSYFQDIYRYLLSLCNDHFLAEDLVQETFCRAYLYLESCREEQIKPWLIKVAHNAFIDYQRKNRRNQLQADFYLSDRPDNQSPEADFIRMELLRSIIDIINSLPENQKQSIILCDFGGLSYQEAASMMGIREGHLKVLLFRARQRIRQEKGEERVN